MFFMQFLEVPLWTNSVVTLLVSSRGWSSFRVVFSQTRNFTVIAFTDANMYATSMTERNVLKATVPDRMVWLPKPACVIAAVRLSKALASGLPNRKSAAVCEITNVFAAWAQSDSIRCLECCSWSCLCAWQWRTQKIYEGGNSFVTIAWRHTSTFREVLKTRTF